LLTAWSVSCLDYRAALQQKQPAVGSGQRQVLIGLRRVEIGPRLAQLLIDFRSLDFGQQVALFDVRSHIEIPVR
jgi:hypothetical protein